MGEVVAQITGMTEEDLSNYYFVIRFDRDKIRFPAVQRQAGVLTGTDEQDIHRLIESGWAGTASDIDELNMKMAPFQMYHRIPIVIELYPRVEAERAAAGERVAQEFAEYEAAVKQEEEVLDDAGVQRVFNDLMALQAAFRGAWGNAQERDDSGRFGHTIMRPTGAKPKDLLLQMFGRDIPFAANGQVRMATGRLGPKPVDIDGSVIKPGVVPSSSPFRLRRDGHVWMRARVKGKKKKTRWIRITD